MTQEQPANRRTGTLRQRIRVLLVDDHPALRAGLRSLLSTEPDIEVAGEAASGEEAYAWYRAHLPDVVLMDLSMEGMGGMEALRRILQLDAAARILVYSVHATEVMLNRALSLGALGYVTKANDTGVLVDGIREVARRRGFVSPDLILTMPVQFGVATIAVAIPNQATLLGFELFAQGMALDAATNAAGLVVADAAAARVGY